MKDNPSLQEVEAIIKAESDYWSEQEGDLGIAAVGACANIIAAIHGIRAPWHPKVNGNGELADAPELCPVI